MKICHRATHNSDFIQEARQKKYRRLNDISDKSQRGGSGPSSFKRVAPFRLDESDSEVDEVTRKLKKQKICNSPESSSETYNVNPPTPPHATDVAPAAVRGMSVDA